MVIGSFISSSETRNILSFVDNIEFNLNIHNRHIKKVANRLNGKSYMFDISKTNISTYLSSYQSSNNICNIELPNVIYDIKDRITNRLKICDRHVFLQILDMNSGGTIVPHYDTSIDGYINYKCNISVISEDYTLMVNKNPLNIKEGDLYAFEASLFKHWTLNEFTSRRVLLSFGFALTYNELGWNENDPRIRLSKRINKYFQN